MTLSALSKSPMAWKRAGIPRVPSHFGRPSPISYGAYRSHPPPTHLLPEDFPMQERGYLRPRSHGFHFRIRDAIIKCNHERLGSLVLIPTVDVRRVGCRRAGRSWKTLIASRLSRAARRRGFLVPADLGLYFRP